MDYVLTARSGVMSNASNRPDFTEPALVANLSRRRTTVHLIDIVLWASAIIAVLALAWVVLLIYLEPSNGAGGT